MVCESIRMFALCEAMNWAQLPLPGGLYAQHPKLIDDFYFIFIERAKEEARQAEKNKPKTPKAPRR